MMTLDRAFLNKYVAPIIETFGENTYASRRILPRVPVGLKKYSYRQRDGSAYRIVDTKVGPRGTAANLDTGSDWKFGDTTRHFGKLFVPGPILDEMDKQGVGTYMAEETEEAKETFLIEEEKDLADVLTLAATFTNYDTPATKWDATGGDMQLDILTKQATIKNYTGSFADLLVVTDNVYLAALKLFRSADGFGMLPSDQVLATLFRVKEVIPVGAIYNSAAKGQTDVIAEMWRQNQAAKGAAWLIYRGRIGTRSGKGFGHTAVLQVNKQDVAMDTDVLKDPRGTKVLIEMDYEQKIRNETSCFMWHTALK